MANKRNTDFIVSAIAVFVSFGAVATAYGACGTEWGQQSPLFRTAIEYDDPLSKANPTVHVFIDGKAVKMMLDTGASANLLWDASVLKEAPEAAVNRVDSHVASADARRVRATLADHHGNAMSQEFYLVSDAVLAQEGYAGILSPQQVSGDNALLVDLHSDCLIVGGAFDTRADARFSVYPGRSLANPYGVMAIPIGLGSGRIPVVVDSGASVSSLLATLVQTKPRGAPAPRRMDVFGAIMPAPRMRLVDLNINGKVFKSHPVIPRPAVDDRGITDFGFIGMDILKNLVIYYDKARGEFNLLVPRNSSARIDAPARRDRQRNLPDG
ncbi:hypothetical protein [Bordetella sp. 02P26C-1]|uniref:hypothetical protein n=1 Tax=Bordetella sp. 02P26C-1 TaxID=2683195 RepID=UPI00135537F6|nr:hypothetical protein [Bordetella sp. 02P26C-1]MVW79445.1 hypothetical protein [Bordetella sp. 02P26C-1]